MKKLLPLIPILICVNSFSQVFFRNDSPFVYKSFTQIARLNDNPDLQGMFAAKQNLVTTGTTAQYFRGDLSLAPFPTTTAAFSNSTNKNFVTDAQATVIGNTSGTNSGDNATNSQYSGLVSNANHTGDATGSTALTLATVNSNVGSFGSATQAGTFTVNGKGLITAASNTTIAIPQSAVTNLVTDLAAKQATLVSGTNIKTVNGNTLLGSGDVSISGAPTFINLTSAFSSTSTTPATVTGWSFAVTSGKTYRIEVIADYQTAATTTGGILAISLTTATGSVRGHAKGTVVNTAAASDLVIPIRTTTGAGSSLTTTGVTAASSPHYIGLLITFTCTGGGTFNIQWATEVSTSAAQLNANSSLIYQALN